MNPYLSIWTKTRPTIDYVTSRRWSQWQQIIAISFLGINVVATGKGFATVGVESIFWQLFLIVGVGFMVGVLFRWIWSTTIYFSGKIWNGSANIRSIERVIALSCVPEGIITIHWISMALLNPDHTIQPRLYSPMYFVCNIITWRILLIGLARAQKFTYGTVLVNILVPYFIFAVLITMIKTLF